VSSTQEKKKQMTKTAYEKAHKSDLAEEDFKAAIMELFKILQMSSFLKRKWKVQRYDAYM
jgi:hypothetical protein